MRKTETLNLRVSAAFKRKLVENARQEQRSVTNYLEATLNRLWEQQELKPPARRTRTQE